MKWTNAFRRDETGLVHVVANELTGIWGAACDPGSSMPRVSTGPAVARCPGPATCVACVVGDIAWWRRNPR